jgi:excisionase family DNA binding protein
MNNIVNVSEVDLLTVPEAAHRLRLSRVTIWRLLNRGELTRVRIGRSVRVTTESVVRIAKRGGAS